jgi:hypothetical protein
LFHFLSFIGLPPLISGASFPCGTTAGMPRLEDISAHATVLIQTGPHAIFTGYATLGADHFIPPKTSRGNDS